MKLFQIDLSVRLVIHGRDSQHVRVTAETINTAILFIGKKYRQCENLITKLHYDSIQEVDPSQNKMMTHALAPGWYQASNGTRVQIYILHAKDGPEHDVKLVRLFTPEGSLYEITTEQCDEYNLVLTPHD